MAESARLNPFNSDVFFWIDAGYIRGDDYRDNDWVYLVPPSVVMSCEGLYINLIAGLEDRERMIGPDGQALAEIAHSSPRFAGGFFGGTKEAVLSWESALLQVFGEYVRKGKFTGKDQNMFASLCLQNASLCNIIHLSHEWFGMIPFILGRYPNAKPQNVVPIFLNVTNLAGDPPSTPALVEARCLEPVCKIEPI